MTQDEMVRWHHQLNGHEFEKALGDGEGQGSLAHCRTWVHKESDTTERLKNNNRVSGLKYWLLIGSERGPGSGMLVSS